MQLDWRSWLQLLQVVSAFISSVLLLTVVGADFILAMMRKGYEQNRTFQGSSLQATLHAKFESLTSVGLTDIAVGESEFAKQIGETVGNAAKRGIDWASGKS